MKILKNKYPVIISIIIILLFSISSCFGPYVEGSGNVIERDRKVSDFHKIDISGGFDVFITESNREKLRIVADDNLHEYIESRVINNRLIIESTINIRKAKKREIYLEVKSLDDISVSGAVELKANSPLKAETMKIDASGAVEIYLEIRAEKLISELSGACELYLSGKVKKVNMRASGGVEIEAFELITERFDLEISGAGYAAVNTSDLLDVKVSGAAKVRYKGNPDVRKDITGAASLRKY